MNLDAAGHDALLGAYQQEADCYARALELAHGLPQELAQGQSGAEKLQQIFACFEEVVAIEARIAPAKQRFQDDGQKAGAELQAVLDRVSGLIQSLAQCMAETERQAVLQRLRLIPELDDAIRGRQMLRAYDRARGL